MSSDIFFKHVMEYLGNLLNIHYDVEDKKANKAKMRSLTKSFVIPANLLVSQGLGNGDQEHSLNTE